MYEMTGLTTLRLSSHNNNLRNGHILKTFHTLQLTLEISLSFSSPFIKSRGNSQNMTSLRHCLWMTLDIRICAIIGNCICPLTFDPMNEQQDLNYLTHTLLPWLCRWVVTPNALDYTKANPISNPTDELSRQVFSQSVLENDDN